MTIIDIQNVTRNLLQIYNYNIVDHFLLLKATKRDFRGSCLLNIIDDPNETIILLGGNAHKTKI